MRKTIIDCDPGIDDAMGILLAHKGHQLDIVGLASVFGNADIEVTTRNAVHLRNTFGIKAPVYQGAGLALDKREQTPPDFVHGKDGLGDLGKAINPGAPDGDNAGQFIVDSVMDNPNELTLIVLGRLTNLAQAVLLEPRITELVEQVVVMGGAFGFGSVRGNVSPCAEANIFGDARAADLVCQSGFPIAFVGLDVTMRCIIDNALQAKIKKSQQPECQFVGAASDFYADFYKSVGFPGGFPMHDACAVAFAMAPDLFKVEEGPVRVATSGVARGQTIMSTDRNRVYEEDYWSAVGLARVCVDIDADAVLDLYESTILEG